MWKQTTTTGVDEFERMRRQLWIDAYLARENTPPELAIRCADAALDAFDAKFSIVIDKREPTP